MTIAEFLTALAAKLAGMGVAAKAALGLTLASASVATAGAAGVLPDQAQHAVATVVNGATPLDIPDPTGDVTKTVADLTGAHVPATVGENDADDVTAADDAEPADNHGACVSAVAKSAPTGADGVHGKAVSEAAKSCPKPSAAGTPGNSGDEDDDEVAATTTVTTLESGNTNQGSASDDAGRGSQGQGQGQGQAGQGHGNSGAEPGESGGRGR